MSAHIASLAAAIQDIQMQQSAARAQHAEERAQLDAERSQFQHSLDELRTSRASMLAAHQEETLKTHDESPPEPDNVVVLSHHSRKKPRTSVQTSFSFHSLSAKHTTIAIIMRKAFPPSGLTKHSVLVSRLSKALYGDDSANALLHILETSEDYLHIKNQADLGLPFDICHGTVKYILAVMALTLACSNWPPAPIAALQEVILDALFIPDTSSISGATRGLYVTHDGASLWPEYISLIYAGSIVRHSSLHKEDIPYAQLLSNIWFDDLREHEENLYIVGDREHYLSRINFLYQDLRKNQLIFASGSIGRIFLRPLPHASYQELFMVYNTERDCPFIWQHQLDLVLYTLLTLAAAINNEQEEGRIAHHNLTLITQQLSFDRPSVTYPWHYLEINSSAAESMQSDLDAICGMVRGHNLPASPWLRDLLSKTSTVTQNFTLFNEDYLHDACYTDAIDHGLQLSPQTYEPRSLYTEVHWVDLIATPTYSDPSQSSYEES
jgi:hypothetical protein